MEWIECPYCDGSGISRYSHYGFRYPCTICDGKGKPPKDNNADFKRKWKKFIKEQDKRKR